MSISGTRLTSRSARASTGGTARRKDGVCHGSGCCSHSRSRHSSAVVAAVALALPYSGAGRSLGVVSLPLALNVAVTAGYAAAAEGTKALFFRRR